MRYRLTMNGMYLDSEGDWVRYDRRLHQHMVALESVPLALTKTLAEKNKRIRELEAEVDERERLIVDNELLRERVEKLEAELNWILDNLLNESQLDVIPPWGVRLRDTEVTE